MNERGAKIAAGATVVGLAALGGVALGTNPGAPAPTLVVRGGGQGTGSPIVTAASGATAAPAASVVAGHRRTNAGAPVVTRASGGAGLVHDD